MVRAQCAKPEVKPSGAGRPILLTAVLLVMSIEPVKITDLRPKCEAHCRVP